MRRARADQHAQDTEQVPEQAPAAKEQEAELIPEAEEQYGINCGYSGNENIEDSRLP